MIYYINFFNTFKKSVCVCLFLLFSISYAQPSKLQGEWILDYVLYKNVNPIEINNSLYSTLITYYFSANSLKINNHPLDITVDQNKIITVNRIVNYSFQGDFLVINDEGSDKNYFFLTKKAFVAKYPEFELQEVNYEGKTVFKPNSVIYPKFRYRTNSIT